MKQIIKRHGLPVILSVAGLIGGFLYWRFVGCKTGSCPITSTWYMSVLMGGLIGYLIGDTIHDIRNKIRSKHERIVE